MIYMERYTHKQKYKRRENHTNIEKYTHQKTKRGGLDKTHT